jgi:hypothetical protein
MKRYLDVGRAIDPDQRLRGIAGSPFVVALLKKILANRFDE